MSSGFAEKLRQKLKRNLSRARANFFDGKHIVKKGASPRTSALLVRPSFRNWFQPFYSNLYATFRCVEN